jgi:SP family sugar:H+ symporter-like MFS transporter
MNNSLTIHSTRFITDAIDYFYGLVYAGCCAALVAIVFFFVIESKDRSLEEIDTMYVQKVNPITSSKWIPNNTSKGAREGVTDEEASS